MCFLKDNVLFVNFFNLMGLFDFIFKSKKEREQDKRVKNVLKKTDEFIERTEKMLDEMKKDDER